MDCTMSMYSSRSGTKAPSDKVINLGLKANTLRADLTDTLPGGRKVTDLYENTVPGPQYGPLALPAAGAFAGVAQIWKCLGTPGKGAAIGLAMALPFIPGVLGSRKTGGKLRDIYSGEEQVPVRSGRWWKLESIPFEGARIKAWRPRWSILHKTRAEDTALYGSEKENMSIYMNRFQSACSGHA
jgi:hypothetical protein